MYELVIYLVYVQFFALKDGQFVTVGVAACHLILHAKSANAPPYACKPIRAVVHS